MSSLGPSIPTAHRAPAVPPAPDTPERKKLMQAVRDFEAIFIGMMLKQAENSAMADDPLGKGPGASIFRDMLADERAKAMSQSGGLGLADGLYRELAQRV